MRGLRHQIWKIRLTSERRKEQVVCLATVSACSLANVIEDSKYSSLGKLLRVTAWIIRFIRNLRASRTNTPTCVGKLSVSEVQEAEALWIKD